MDDQPQPTLLPLSLQRLIDDIESTRDVTTPSGQLVRLRRLDLRRKLDLVERLDVIELNEEGAIASQRDALEFGVAVLSGTIIDEEGNATFDSEAGREALGSLQIEDLNLLINEANSLNGFRGETAAKKND